MDAKTFLQGYVPLFTGVADQHLDAMATASTLQSFKKGQTVIFQGITVDALHVVVVGKVSVHAKVPGKGLTQVAELGMGEVVGEASIFESGTAGAAVKAAEDAQILIIPQDAFKRLLAENPEFVARVKALIASRRGG